jgi:D-alanine-D-alanine ligase
MESEHARDAAPVPLTIRVEGSEVMRVIVLLGGDSPERDVSKVSGRAVAEALIRAGHDVIALDTAGPQAGMPIDLARATQIGVEPPSDALVPANEAVRAVSRIGAHDFGDVDVVFVALHGGRGEDGTIQALLELTGIPYTGSGVMASSVAMDKETSKRIFRDLGVPTPRGFAADASLPVEELTARIGRECGYPAIAKPNSAGSSVGFSIIHDASEVKAAVVAAAPYDARIVFEQFIPGREMTVAVLDGQALPVVEIVPQVGVYDYRSKYTPGSSRYQVPAEIPAAATLRLQELALRCFHGLRCRDFARIDFRLSPEDEAYCLEVNTIPGMTPTSLVPKAAKAAGLEFDAVVERIVRLAAARGRVRSSR